MDVLTSMGNVLSTSLVSLLVFVGLLIYTLRDKNLPPGPYLPPLRRREFLHLSLTELSREYGPIFSFRAGRRLTVVLNSAMLMKEALIKQADIFADRFQNSGINLFLGGHKGSIVFDNGPQWRELKRFGANAMRSFGVGKRSLANKTIEETRHLLAAIADQKGQPFNPAHIVSNAVSNIICSISFGDRYEYDDPNFQELLSTLRVMLLKSATGFLYHVFPYMVFLPPYRDNFKRYEFIKTFFADIVDKHRRTLDPNDARDIIDMFLIQADKGKINGDFYIETDHVWRTILDLFSAGTDTTASTILWAIALLCHHPDIQKKMFDEIAAVIGNERLPSYEDRPKLPYTEAVILEVQRYRPVLTLFPHCNTHDTVVGGYHIPKGSIVLINLWASLHNPGDWGDPELFRPERFIDVNGKVVRPEAHTPYGLGRRICFGESLAKMELFVFITSIVQRFRFFVQEGSALPALDGQNGITHSPKPYDVSAEVRS